MLLKACFIPWVLNSYSFMVPEHQEKNISPYQVVHRNIADNFIYLSSFYPRKAITEIRKSLRGSLMETHHPSCIFTFPGPSKNMHTGQSPWREGRQDCNSMLAPEPPFTLVHGAFFWRAVSSFVWDLEGNFYCFVCLFGVGKYWKRIKEETVLDYPFLKILWGIFLRAFLKMK